MSKSRKRLILSAFFLLVTVTISSSLFLLEILNYIGTIKSTRQLHIEVVSMKVELSDDEISIRSTFSILNPTFYSRVKLIYIYYKFFLNVNSHENLIGSDTYFVHDILTPNKDMLINVTLTVPKSRNQYLVDHVSKIELDWHIKCLIHIETPIKNYYETIDIYKRVL